ncbi:hypothetical protein D3C73_1346960 [compost metagenome]
MAYLAWAERPNRRSDRRRNSPDQKQPGFPQTSGECLEPCGGGRHGAAAVSLRFSILCGERQAELHVPDAVGRYVLFSVVKNIDEDSREIIIRWWG